MDLTHRFTPGLEHTRHVRCNVSACRQLKPPCNTANINHNTHAYINMTYVRTTRDMAIFALHA